LCDPQVRLEQARQFLPPESLQVALFSLQQLELIEGPPAEVPKTRDRALDAGLSRLAEKLRDFDPSAA